MYLRKTKRKNTKGSTVTYYQLAHNVWNPVTKRATAQVIYNFGRADQLDRGNLVRLCRSIARVCGLEVQDPLEAASPSDSPPAQAELPDGFCLVQTLQLGLPTVIESLWQELGIASILQNIAQEEQIPPQFERALLVMTANRLCEPESKLGTWSRWLKKVYLPSCQDISLAQMYKAMDFLYRHCAKVEESLFFHLADLLNLEVDLIFYDTTTASFSVDYADEEEDGEEGLRQMGRAKEGMWSVQVVVALAVTNEGYPVKSWVFPGNTTDVNTIEQVKADLKAWKLGRALFVGDAGMNSEDNRKILAKACGKYLLAARMTSVKEIKENVLTHKGRYLEFSENLRAKEVIVGDGERRQRYILCHNPKEERRQREHRRIVVEELEEKLASHQNAQATAQWAIELQASKRFKRYLRKTKSGKLMIDKMAIRKAERYDGKWVIMTNDDTLSVEEAAQGYKSLMVIERCFRTLKKTQIRMTPMYHWLPKRIESHVKICVLALLIERVMEIRMGHSFSRVKTVLEHLQVSEFQTKDFSFFQRNELSDEVAGMLKTLKISVPKKIIEVQKR